MYCVNVNEYSLVHSYKQSLFIKKYQKYQDTSISEQKTACMTSTS